MVKLLRLSRMAKLLHAVPELTIIMKGIKYASRSVACMQFSSSRPVGIYRTIFGMSICSVLFFHDSIHAHVLMEMLDPLIIRCG